MWHISHSRDLFKKKMLLCIFLKCQAGFPLLPKILGHFEHAKCFSWVCVLSWFVIIPFLSQLYSHLSHLYGFSPRETHTCVIVNNQTLQMPDHILDIWTSFLTMFYFGMIFKTGFIRKNLYHIHYMELLDCLLGLHD